MTLKQFNMARTFTAVILAAAMAQAVIGSNYYLAVAMVVIAGALMRIFRRRLTEVAADERDYSIAGKAARYTLGAFSVCTAVATFVLMSMRAKDPLYAILGATFAYSTCFILLLYSAIFKFLSTSQNAD